MVVVDVDGLVFDVLFLVDGFECLVFLFEDKFICLFFFKIIELLWEGLEEELLVEWEVKVEVEDMDEGFIELLFLELLLLLFVVEVMVIFSFVGGCGGGLLEV